MPVSGVATGRPTGGEPEPFLQTPFNEGGIQMSRDGRWVSYQSNEAGSAPSEVFVRPFPGPGGKWRISSGGGTDAVWSRKDDQIFYRTPAGIMVVDYKA